MEKGKRERERENKKKTERKIELLLIPSKYIFF